jgi:hypothetical protein
MQMRLLWLTIGLLAACLLFCLVLRESESNIRLTGGLLQLLGLGTVVWGIHDTRKLFGLPPVLSKFREWLRKRPGQPVIVQLSGVAAVGSTGRFASTGAPSSLGPNASIEDRLAALEHNQMFIQHQFHALRERDDTIERDLKTSMDTERTERRNATFEVQSKLSAFATGGIYLSTMGTIWILAGTMLSTASTEIECAIRWLSSH